MMKPYNATGTRDFDPRPAATPTIPRRLGRFVGGMIAVSALSLVAMAALLAGLAMLAGIDFFLDQLR